MVNDIFFPLPLYPLLDPHILKIILHTFVRNHIKRSYLSFWGKWVNFAQFCECVESVLHPVYIILV